MRVEVPLSSGIIDSTVQSFTWTVQAPGSATPGLITPVPLSWQMTTYQLWTEGTFRFAVDIARNDGSRIFCAGDVLANASPIPTDTSSPLPTTPTFTPTTPTATHTTPTPTGTTEARVHLPLVANQPTPTPSLPKWQALAQSPKSLDTVTIQNNALFVGDRGSTQPGIYRASSCELNAPFAQRMASVPIVDLAFNGSNGLAATNNKIYFSRNNGDSWSQTSSDVYAESLSVTFVTASRAYAGTDRGFYESDNSGVTWNKIGADRRLTKLYYEQLTNTLWLSTFGEGLWKFTPGTVNFVAVNTGLNDEAGEKRVWELVIVNNDYYIGTTNGIWKSSGGSAWQQVGLPKILVFSLEAVGNQRDIGWVSGGTQYVSFSVQCNSLPQE